MLRPGLHPLPPGGGEHQPPVPPAEAGGSRGADGPRRGPLSGGKGAGQRSAWTGQTGHLHHRQYRGVHHEGGEGGPGPGDLRAVLSPHEAVSLMGATWFLNISMGGAACPSCYFALPAGSPPRISQVQPPRGEYKRYGRKMPVVLAKIGWIWYVCGEQS